MTSPEATFTKLFHSHVPRGAHIVRIETGGTGLGIPDDIICLRGVSPWFEFKIVKGRQVLLSPEQVAWHYRWNRAGGKSWIVARDKFDGPRKGKGDRIYIWPGSDAVQVREKGLDASIYRVYSAPFNWIDLMGEFWS